MAAQSTALQSHVQQLADCLEDLQRQRAGVVDSARQEEAERAQLAQDAAVLQQRLGELEASLEKRAAATAAYDLGISQTQAALCKLADSSRLLLAAAKRSAAEAASLSSLAPKEVELPG